MLVKMTSKNQITIPKKLMAELPESQYFDIDLKDGMLLLKPVQIYDTDLDQIRSKMKKLGLKPDSVKEAVRWARLK